MTQPPERFVRLIGPDDVVVLEVDGTRFRVRRIPHGEMVRLTRQCSVKGKLDGEAFERALWRQVLAGWENLVNADGTPLGYAEDLVPDVISALPSEITDRILRCARGHVPETEGA